MINKDKINNIYSDMDYFYKNRNCFAVYGKNKLTDFVEEVLKKLDGEDKRSVLCRSIHNLAMLDFYENSFGIKFICYFNESVDENNWDDYYNNLLKLSNHLLNLSQKHKSLTEKKDSLAATISIILFDILDELYNLIDNFPKDILTLIRIIKNSENKCLEQYVISYIKRQDTDNRLWTVKRIIEMEESINEMEESINEMVAICNRYRYNLITPSENDSFIFGIIDSSPTFREIKHHIINSNKLIFNFEGIINYIKSTNDNNSKLINFYNSYLDKKNLLCKHLICSKIKHDDMILITEHHKKKSWSRKLDIYIQEINNNYKEFFYIGIILKNEYNCSPNEFNLRFNCFEFTADAIDCITTVLRCNEYIINKLVEYLPSLPENNDVFKSLIHSFKALNFNHENGKITYDAKTKLFYATLAPEFLAEIKSAYSDENNVEKIDNNENDCTSLIKCINHVELIPENNQSIDIAHNCHSKDIHYPLKGNNQSEIPDMVETFKDVTRDNAQSPSTYTSSQGSQIRDEEKHIENIRKETVSQVRANTNYDKIRNVTIKEKHNKIDIKIFLTKEYAGHCQICNFTFTQQNQSNYFKTFDLFGKHINKDYAIKTYHKGASLCLCGNCHAIMHTGNVNPYKLNNIEPHILKTFHTFIEHVAKEEEDYYKIPILFDNQDRFLSYTHEHILELYTLFTLNKSNNDFHSLCQTSDSIEHDKNICTIKGKEVNLLSTMINLSGLDLENIPEQIKESINLNTLIIENNKIKHIPTELFEQIPHQIKIYIHGNESLTYNIENDKIKIFPNPEWYYELIKWKEQHEINDKTLPSDYCSLQCITELNLANTNISEIPKEISYLTNLVRINLFNSGLNEENSIPESIFSMKSLKEICIPVALYEKYKSMFDEIKGLKINLQHND